MGCDPGWLSLFFVFMENEEWRPVVGYELTYQVSNLGRVRSLDKTVNSPSGPRPKKGQIVKGCFSHAGYLQVNLWDKQKHNTQKIHRLVAFAFLENPNNYDQVNHKNLQKTDNRVENLEWCNGKQNIKHANDNGMVRKGSEKVLAKLTEQQVIEIRMAHSENMCACRVKRGFVKKLAEKYNVSESLIEKVVRRVNWKHI